MEESLFRPLLTDDSSDDEEQTTPSRVKARAKTRAGRCADWTDSKNHSSQPPTSDDDDDDDDSKGFHVARRQGRGRGGKARGSANNPRASRGRFTPRARGGGSGSEEEEDLNTNNNAIPGGTVNTKKLLEIFTNFLV